MNLTIASGRPKQHLRNDSKARRPSQEEAEAAVRTLIEWAGDDPDREGLVDTPERVVRAYEEFFAGYFEDPVAMLTTTFEETADYDEMIVMRDIRLEQRAEHSLGTFGVEDVRPEHRDLSVPWMGPCRSPRR